MTADFHNFFVKIDEKQRMKNEMKQTYASVLKDLCQNIKWKSILWRNYFPGFDDTLFVCLICNETVGQSQNIKWIWIHQLGHQTWSYMKVTYV